MPALSFTRRARLAGVLCLAGGGALLAFTARGQEALPASEPPPPTRPAVAPGTDWQEAARIYGAAVQERQRYYMPPWGKVPGAGSDAYSRRVNRFLCAWTFPSGSDGTQTWLGTRMGIKRVQAGRGIVGAYGRAHGLPGDLIEDIAGDARGAVALVHTPTGGRALCWWDRRADKWRTLADLTYRPSHGWRGDYGPQMRWRFVLTPTRLVLAPPQIVRLSSAARPKPAPGDLDPEGISVWERGDLEAGRSEARAVRWDEALLNQGREYGAQPTFTSMAAVGETVFLGGRIGLVCLPPTTLAGDDGSGKGDDNPNGFLPVTPRMPRFRAGSHVAHLAAGGGGVWAVFTSADEYSQPRTLEIARLTPEVQNGTFTGLKQNAAPLPPDPSPVREQAARIRQLIPDGAGLWATTDGGYLHWTGSAWERLGHDGIKIAPDAAEPQQLGKHWFPDDYHNVPPLVAPPAADLPDAVVRAYALEPLEENGQRAPYESQRRVAWIRQRLPHFFNPPVAVPRMTASLGQGAVLPSSDTTGGEAHRFVSDPARPDVVWHSSGAVVNSKTVLWRLPKADVPAWQWAATYNGQTEALIRPVSTGRAQSAVLPRLPARVHLGVNGLAVRADGLYVGVRDGVLHLPRAGVAGAGASPETGARSLRFETEQGIKTQAGMGGRLYQAGPDGSLFWDTNTYQKPHLRFDQAKQRFVPDAALPSGPVVGGSAGGLFTRAVQRTETAQGTTFSTGDAIDFTPLGKGGLARAGGVTVRTQPRRGEHGSPQAALGGPGYPFRDGYVTQVGVGGGKLWFVGSVEDPARPRYSHRQPVHAVAGCDVRSRRWTRPLELPDSQGQRRATVREEDGQTYVAFYAPDGSVWRYDGAHNRWQAVAPPLAPDAQNYQDQYEPPHLWTARGGDVWAVTRRAAYHLETGPRRGWSRYPGPETFLKTLSHHSEPPQLAALGPNLFIGGAPGLWRFDTVTRKWSEVAPLASGMEGAKVSLFAQSLAASGGDVYLAGAISVENNFNWEGFLLRYGKDGKWTPITAQMLGLPELNPQARVVGDARTVWYGDEKNTCRLNRATGKWSALAGGWRQILPDPADPGSAYLRDLQRLARYDARTGEVQTLVVTNDYSERGWQAPIPAGTLFNAIAPHRGGLIAATSTGLYTVDPQGRAARLPLPFPQSATLISDEGGDVYAYDSDTIVRLPR